MKTKSNHEREIERLLQDTQFAKRTAAAVIQKAGQSEMPKAVTPIHRGWYIAVAAVAALAVGLFWTPQKEPASETYAGLIDTSATLVVSQLDTFWEDTDLLIDDLLGP